MKPKDNRIPALIRFASAITVLNLFGHFYLGFEQSIAHWVVALTTAYSLEIIFELINAKLNNTKPAFLVGGKEAFYFFLPSHITASAVSMLLFTNERIVPIIFATAIGVLSKVIFRVKMNGKLRHFLNPSNTGIGVMLLLFPWVGVAPPYQFSEVTSGWQDWMLVGIFLTLGSFLNTVFTKKIPLILAWLGGFFLQAVIRTNLMDTSTIAAILPMTGIGFLLFTFYMISDPATTPIKTKNQIFFGLSVAAVYGIMMSLHIVFALFIALMIVCTVRGIYYWMTELFTEEKAVLVPKNNEVYISKPESSYASMMNSTVGQM